MKKSIHKKIKNAKTLLKSRFSIKKIMCKLLKMVFVLKIIISKPKHAVNHSHYVKEKNSFPSHPLYGARVL